MSQQAVMGALCMCSFGTAPTPLTILPINMVNASYMPAATIMDNIPFLNIIPFAMCTSMANPAVASATAGVFPWGVLKPQPCTPTPPAPWIPGSPTILIKGKPALNSTCKLMCAFGGVINMTFPGQVTVQLNK